VVSRSCFRLHFQALQSDYDAAVVAVILSVVGMRCPADQGLSCYASWLMRSRFCMLLGCME
jgi:hypothetical protein